MNWTEKVNRIIDQRLDELRKELKPIKDHKERVEKAIEVPKQVTEDVGALIAADYAEINRAIDRLEKNDPNLGEKVHALKELKKYVPYRYKITQAQRLDIVDEINKAISF